ncbi:MAG: VOC family protein [Sulfitobacter sp.]
MRKLAIAFFVSALIGGSATAEPFKEVTVGVPVTSIADAEAWYLNLFGKDVEILRPDAGVVEFKVSPDVWFQIFETDVKKETDSVIRFKVDNVEVFQQEAAKTGIDTGEAIAVPEIVTFSEFSDPDGNALGLYSLP